ncbi:hypothetical protein FHR81_002822 [Actinoalloteichus hoggarensis]|uniref:Uncharacterized protein n=1 Tax=Actinoalloteichus hoggarensis TaxID=1470176 RepID=A0A221VXY7_9PSEU|nr:hypothetical protein [Actinoalloteichus hoggarensis]ASO18416.1 hypothetical protein AHOG_03800 [Actinoalloteichus hoggarensis]MBB5921782.1 hypothetical protein [Actinoalloteichus hoggarensis]
MVSFADLRRAEPGRFEKAAENWSDHAVRLGRQAEDLVGRIAELDGWQGAAEAARGHFGRLHDQFAEAAETLTRIPPILRELTDRTETARERLLDAVRRAGEAGISVHDDGSLSGPSRGPGHQGTRWDEFFADAERIRDEARETIAADVVWRSCVLETRAPTAYSVKVLTYAAMFLVDMAANCGFRGKFG